MPDEFLLCEARPESLEIALRLAAKLAIGVHARDIGLPHESIGGRKDPRLLQNSFDRCIHAVLRNGW